MKKAYFSTLPPINEKEIYNLIESAQFVTFPVLSPFASSFTPTHPQMEAENMKKFDG